MRFTEEEKLTIMAEGEKTGVKTVCAKYAISDQTYRDWRYKALGIKPRKHLSSAKRLRVLREGEKNGVRVACAKYGISDQTYRVWRYEAQGIKPRKHFSLRKKLKILEEGCRKGIYRTCAAYHIDPVTYYNWKRRFGFTKSPKAGGWPKKQLSRTEKLRILEEGYQNGINQVCTVHRIHPMTYYRWKKALGYSKSRRRGRSRRFSREEVLAIVKEAEETSTKAVCEKYKISPSRYTVLHYEVTGIPLVKRFSLEEKRRILEEGYQNGIYRVCNARQIHPTTTYYYWKKCWATPSADYRPKRGDPDRQ
jgi:transposase-like protein